MTIHCTVGRLVSKWVAIEGRAILTLPVSTTEAKLPMAMAPKPQYL